MVIFIPNGKQTAIRLLCKPISTDGVANIKADVILSFYTILPLNKIEMFNEFSMIKLKGEIDVLIRKFLNVFYFPNPWLLQQKVLRGYL